MQSKTCNFLYISLVMIVCSLIKCSISDKKCMRQLFKLNLYNFAKILAKKLIKLY